MTIKAQPSPRPSNRALELAGTVRCSQPGMPRKTVGKFNLLIKSNSEVFRKYFGVDLFPGSLNVDVPEPETLQSDLDQGKYQPAFAIPRSELRGMSD